MRLRMPDSPAKHDLAGLYGTAEGRLICQGWFANRLVVGVLGVLMPFVLWGGEAWLFPKGTVSIPRHSLSAYFYSGLSGVFVGTLWVTGVFLVTYRVVEWSWENVASTLAGLSAVGVALFPTGPDNGEPLTPVQERFGQGAVQTVHYVCAGSFIAFLCVMSVFFAVEEHRRGNRRLTAFHGLMALVMALAALLGYGLSLTGRKAFGPWSLLLLVEFACTLAFGASWLVKGLELARSLVLRGAYGARARARFADPLLPEGLRVPEQPQPHEDLLPGHGG